MMDKDKKLIDSSDVDEADLAKVQADADNKLMRHRLDDYVCIILGVGVCLLLWFLQLLGVY